MRISDWSSDVCSSDLHASLLEIGHGDKPRRAGVVIIGRETVVETVLVLGIAQARRHLHRRGQFIARLAIGGVRGALLNEMLRGANTRGQGPGRQARAIERAAWIEIGAGKPQRGREIAAEVRSEEHTSELQSPMRISYAVFR